jgi:hypothetical protein
MFPRNVGISPDIRHYNTDDGLLKMVHATLVPVNGGNLRGEGAD